MFPAFSSGNKAKRHGVIDFDRVLREPASPTRMLKIHERPDHAHPNDAGYKAMADSIDLKLFKNPKNH